MENTLTLDRVIRSDDEGVFGTLKDGNEHLCFTLERYWINNKIDVSCIPPGLYNLKTYKRTNGAYAFRILDVKDRTLIAIHSANWMWQLRGCIAVGDGISKILLKSENRKILGVANSVNTMKFLIERYKDVENLKLLISHVKNKPGNSNT